MPIEPISGITIPQSYIDLLAELKAVNSTAIIAGGAIRDLAYGKKSKDIDFFCFGTAIVIPMSWGSAEDKSNIDYEGMQYVMCVQSYKCRDNMPSVNIVYHDQPDNLKLLESFDFGFCQIGYDGKQIIKTAAFDWDFKHGIITLRHIDRYQRSIRRYARWLDRYDYDISIPALSAKEIV